MNHTAPFNKVIVEGLSHDFMQMLFAQNDWINCKTWEDFEEFVESCVNCDESGLLTSAVWLVKSVVDTCEKQSKQKWDLEKRNWR